MAQTKVRFLKWVLMLAFIASTVAACGCGVGCGSADGDSGNGGVLSSLSAPVLTFVSPLETLDLNNYTLARKHQMPSVPALSGVTYNADTDTLFMVGDQAKAVVQINKTTAEKIDAMLLNPGDFLDTEGLTYSGGGEFVMVEEGLRQANLFKYQAGGTLARADVKSVKLGTNAGNQGIEGIGFDPMKNGYLAVKQIAPQGIFETTIDFTAGTASNGSASTVNSVNLFEPVLAQVTDLNDLAVLSSVLASTAPDYSHLLLLSSQSGQIVKLDRTGRIYSTLNVGSTAHHEGITVDKQGVMYVVSEQGTFGNIGEQELWVFTPTLSSAAVGLGSNLYLNFGSQVVVGTGNITISNGTDDTRSVNVTDTSRVRIIGNTVMINPNKKLNPLTKYSIQYPSGAFKEASTGFSISASTPSALGFTTTLPSL